MTEYSFGGCGIFGMSKQAVDSDNNDTRNKSRSRVAKEVKLESIRNGKKDMKQRNKGNPNAYGRNRLSDKCKKKTLVIDAVPQLKGQIFLRD